MASAAAAAPGTVVMSGTPRRTAVVRIEAASEPAGVVPLAALGDRLAVDREQALQRIAHHGEPVPAGVVAPAMRAVPAGGVDLVQGERIGREQLGPALDRRVDRGACGLDRGAGGFRALRPAVGLRALWHRAGPHVLG